MKKLIHGIPLEVDENAEYLTISAVGSTHGGAVLGSRRVRDFAEELGIPEGYGFYAVWSEVVGCMGSIENLVRDGSIESAGQITKLGNDREKYERTWNVYRKFLEGMEQRFRDKMLSDPNLTLRTLKRTLKDPATLDGYL